MKKSFRFLSYHAHTLMFWPLLILGGKLAVRVVMNLWHMIEQ